MFQKMPSIVIVEIYDTRDTFSKVYDVSSKDI